MAVRSMVAIAREISALKSSPLAEKAKEFGIALLKREAEALMQQAALDLEGGRAEAPAGAGAPAAPPPKGR